MNYKDQRTEELTPRFKKKKPILLIVVSSVIVTALLVGGFLFFKYQQHQNLIQAASEAFENNKFDEAQTFYERIIKNDSQNSEAYLKLGEVHVKKKENEKAIKILKEGSIEIKDEKQLVKIYKDLGEVCIAEKKSNDYMKDLYKEAYEKTEDKTFKDNEANLEKENPDSSKLSNLQEHRYEFFLEDITWLEASQRCKEKGGYLGTFDTDEEFNKVIEMMKKAGHDNKKMYIGGGRTSDSQDYRWIDKSGNYYGSVLNQSKNWIHGDPSFYDANGEGDAVNEMYMMIYYYDKGESWAWADVPNNVPGVVSTYRGKIGYICEFDK